MITIRGTVQGVGFRPFVYNLAAQLDLTGKVSNTADGVLLDVEGCELDFFIEQLCQKAPSLAKITHIEIKKLPLQGHKAFEIVGSSDSGIFTPVCADVAVCRTCLSEIMDRQNPRYMYPFTTCTHCGPRYSITRSVPFDRVNTSMRNFVMCKMCKNEYHEPADRRFHSQTNACTVCGPQVTLVYKGSHWTGLQALQKTVELLRHGAIVAVKGIGGFHLVCNASLDRKIQLLRHKKHRPRKSFAVMFPNINILKKYASVSQAEENILTSNQSPIVLLRKSTKHTLAESISPNNAFLGCMLPYSPLHALLFFNPKNSEANFDALVMTSGNLSDEPIAKDNVEAVEKLAQLADAFLLHNREIVRTVDDSVVRAFHGSHIFLRRSRGFAPEPIDLQDRGPQLIAVGGDLKNTFTLTKDSYAIVSQHIGNMEDFDTQCLFESLYRDMKTLFKIEPKAVVYDMHPGYFSSRWAMAQNGLKKLSVQHHHAHAASVMAEKGIIHPCIGVTLDGLGYGTDGTLWGGEILIATPCDFERFCHFEYTPLPGGEMAIKQPWRVAAALVMQAYGQEEAMRCLNRLGFIERFGFQKISNIMAMCHDPVFSNLSSGAGRLFEGVSSLLGLCDFNTFEGEAAFALESRAAEQEDGLYPFSIKTRQPCVIEFRQTIRAIVSELLNRISQEQIAAKFHNTVARAITDAVSLASKGRQLNEVVLSGGVFQNVYLLRKTVSTLRENGFTVYWNEKVPANDGGLSLGQAFIARARLIQEGLF